MLKEITNQRLVSERRRLFTDDYMDLFVWYDEHSIMTGFQICFAKDTIEKAFTWLSTGFKSYASVDTGEDSPLKNMSPILVPLRSADKHTLKHEFATRSKGMEQTLSGHILEILQRTANQAL